MFGAKGKAVPLIQLPFHFMTTNSCNFNFWHKTKKQEIRLNYFMNKVA